jgi:hypothetical protein
VLKDMGRNGPTVAVLTDTGGYCNANRGAELDEGGFRVLDIAGVSGAGR